MILEPLIDFPNTLFMHFFPFLFFYLFIYSLVHPFIHFSRNSLMAYSAGHVVSIQEMERIIHTLHSSCLQTGGENSQGNVAL